MLFAVIYVGYNVRTLTGVGGKSSIFAWPEFIQLMDDEIVSLIGLTFIADPLQYRQRLMTR